MARASSVIALLGIGGLAGCTTVGQVSNLSTDPACAAQFEDALADIFTSQRETPADAAHLAGLTHRMVALGNLGPRPFAVPAPSGTDYYLLVESSRTVCKLRLYGRVRGFTRVTNNISWIESRELPACRCSG
jgi:hypothetical protein